MLEGIERIKVLASEIKDKATLSVINYLLSREDMNEKYLNEEKSLKQMKQFIRNEAQKYEEDGGAMIENEEVYGWAIHYWDESNDSLGLSKKQVSSEKIPKEKIESIEAKERVEKTSKVESKKKNWVPEGQLSLFDL